MNKQIGQWSYPVSVGTVLMVVAVGTVILVGLLSRGVMPVQSDTGIYDGPQGLYKYAIAQRVNQPVEIEVVLDPNDPNAMERYRQASNERALKLLASAQAQRLWTTITFARPLPVKEMLLLLEEAGVEATSYTQVGRTISGEWMGSTIFADEADFELEKLAHEAISPSSEGPGAGASTLGFMVVEGYITISSKSLGKLLGDPRVYLVDTTAYELEQLVGKGTAGAAIHLPTPFWDMDWN